MQGWVTAVRSGLVLVNLILLESQRIGTTAELYLFISIWFWVGFVEICFLGSTQIPLIRFRSQILSVSIWDLKREKRYLWVIFNVFWLQCSVDVQNHTTSRVALPTSTPAASLRLFRAETFREIFRLHRISTFPTTASVATRRWPSAFHLLYVPCPLYRILTSLPHIEWIRTNILFNHRSTPEWRHWISRPMGLIKRVWRLLAKWLRWMTLWRS